MAASSGKHCGTSPAPVNLAFVPMHRSALATLLIPLVGAVSVLHAQGPALALADTAVLAGRAFRESSGVAPSRRSPGHYWSINDSGDGPFLYLTDSLGQDQGRLRVSGAGATDWEDLGSGACGNRHCLFIADIGDNNARRARVRVYLVEEPEPTSGPADTLRSVAAVDSLLLRYPGGPRDAEAIAVTPDGWLLLISKARSGHPLLYRTRIDGAARERVLELRDTMPIPVNAVRGRLVTGAGISDDGRLLAVRTYVSLHLFRLDGQALTSLTPPPGFVLPVVEAQGESVAFDGPGRLVMTSERGSRHALLTRLRLTGLGTR